MKKKNTEHAHGARYAAVAGDEQLIREFRPLLESKGFVLLMAHDTHAIRAAGAALAAGLELSMSDGSTKKDSLLLLEEHLPASAMIVSSSVTVTAARQASWMRHPERLIGLCAFPTLMNGPLAEFAIPIGTAASIVRSAHALFAELGIEMVTVQDRVGMVLPGILAQIINEAFFAVQYNVATPEDIDTAMKAGAGYPKGPVEWGETIGFPNIVRLLDAMRSESGEERYRVAPLLRELSVSGTFWHANIASEAAVQEVLQLGDALQPDADASAHTQGREKKIKRTR